MSVKNIIFLWLLIFFGISEISEAQDLMINEVMSSNSITIYDEDGDTPDWIELYNADVNPINLEGFGLSDTLNPTFFWKFPGVVIQPGEHLLVFASDKNRKEIPLHWETVIEVGDLFKYIVPTEEPPADWRTVAFDDSSWSDGKSGFGYGDGDDSTIVGNALTIFYRKTFTVTDPAEVKEALLHMDYDDAFVAFINGTEIARGNIWTGNIPSFDTPADNGNHEAQMYSGGQPEAFFISNISELLVAGDNVLSIQAHNSSTGSSDMTSIPFLSLGYSANNGGSLSSYLQITPKSLHTDFKISSEGETIYLTDASGQLLDTLYTGSLLANISIGSQPDGADNIAYFDEPTPGKSNTSFAFESFAGNVEFSAEGGIYSSSISLALSTANSEDSIYYTMDGSEPTKANSRYVGPINISNTKVVRARVIKHNSVPGIINSATYLFNTDHSIPIISITTDPDNLWDYNEGMYVMGPNASSEQPNYGANFWQDWEKPAHVEMYEPDGTQAFSINAGIKIFGGWSRANAQKSLTIHARKSYGDGSIKYKIFDEKDLNEFSSLVLRNSGNDWNNTMLRDGILTSLFHKDVDRQAFRSAVLYLNGNYWGIQNIREKVNEHFIADNHNLDSDSISLLEMEGLPIHGDEEHYLNMIDFLNNNDLSSASNYEYIKTQMDVPNFIQYLVGNIYVDNTDWPGNNIKFWRENTETGKWKWITYDTDFGFGIWEYNQVTNNTLSFALDPFGPEWPNPPWSTLIFRKLNANSEFRNLFINTFADQMNSQLLPSKVNLLIDQRSIKIRNEIDDHLNRWNGSKGYWTQKVAEMKQFASERPGHVRDHIKGQYNLVFTHSIKLDVNDKSLGTIKINTLDLENYPWSGIYYQGVPVKITAIPETGYRFIRWEGDITSTDASIEIDLTKNTSIKAFFAFEDNELTSIVINEINYNSPDDFNTGDWVELVNRGSQAVDISGWVLKDDDDTHAFVFPDNTFIESNEYLVVCRNEANFTALHPDVSNTIGDMDFGLSGSGDCVRLFTDDGTQVDNVCYDVVSPWPETPNGGGATLALDNPFADNENPQKWYALSNHGNPGVENRLISGLEDEIDNQTLFTYPNPFSTTTTLAFSVNQPGIVKISLLDQQGKLIETLLDKYLNTGEHELPLEIHHGKGMYFVQKESSDGVNVTKLIKR